MGLIRALFSKDQVIDSLAAGADKAFYTKEEKSDDFLTLVKAYEPFKLAQRLLALSLTIPFVVIILLSALVYLASLLFDPCIADQICKSQQLANGSKELLGMTVQGLGESVTWVVVFYFGGGAVEGVVHKFKNRPRSE